MATLQLRKLALKRDPSVPMGQPAPLHLDCPCGAVLPVEPNHEVISCGCGNRYDRAGWMLHAEADESAYTCWNCGHDARRDTPHACDTEGL